MPAPVSSPTPLRVLVCFAVPEEARPFKAGGVASTPANVTILVTGIGEANARAAVEAALRRARPDNVLTCGFAGGLGPELAAGTVVFDADPGSQLEGLLNRTDAVPVRFHCSRRVAVTAAEKGELRARTGADAVEMESGVIRELCRSEGIPSATVRVISDAANEDLPLDFNRLFDAGMRLPPTRIALALVRRPGALPGLLRLQRRTSAAAGALAGVLRPLLTALASGLTRR